MASDELKQKAQDLEISLTRFLSKHVIPPTAADCLTQILKKFIDDSEIVKKMTLGQEKARYLTDFGISEEYEEKTIQKLKECDAFSIGIDESEVNKRSELEMMATV